MRTPERRGKGTMLSPCIRLCTLDALTRLCLGCGRSLAEIGGWTAFSDDERAAIMAALPARLAALAPSPAAPAEAP